jgi:quercetin dioxygenase-like cupin family protein
MRRPPTHKPVNRDRGQPVRGISASRVSRLADLISYQEGSVVSRAIIDRKAGTVTLFAFDAGQGLSEHKAPFDALVDVLDGEVEVVISGKALQLKAGEVIMLPANKPHALRAVQRFKMLLTMIRS